MLLRFESTVEDVLAFNDYHYKHSPKMKRIMAGFRWVPALLAFFAIFTLTMKDGAGSGAIAGLIGASMAAVLCPPLVRWSLWRRIHKLYSRGIHKKILGEHEAVIVEDGIIARTPYSESKYSWGLIEKIESTSEYTFIYVDESMAFIIPHTRIEEGDYKVFMTELGQHYKPDQKLQRTIRQ